MNIPGWLQQPERRNRFCEWLLLGVAVVWAGFRTTRSLSMLFEVSHDLDIYYSIWFLLCHRDYSALAMSQALYLPHTWVLLTPLFIMGWPVTRGTMLLLNIASVFYLWWRLSKLTGLQGVRRWLLLALFWGWLGTGLVIGLGNLALICVAAVLAAFPFTTRSDGILLTISAMKQSLVFPVYFQLLFKRPRVLVLPFVIFAVGGAAALLWARLGMVEGLKMAKDSMDMANAWTLYDYTCLRRLLIPFVNGGMAMSVAVWGIWFALFGIVARFIKDPLTQLAALLLLSLLPMYHEKYDLVAAVPMLAILLRRCSLIWPTLMSLSLAGDPGSLISRSLPAGAFRDFVRSLETGYHPLLILIFLGGLIYLDFRRRRSDERQIADMTGL